MLDDLKWELSVLIDYWLESGIDAVEFVNRYNALKQRIESIPD